MNVRVEIDVPDRIMDFPKDVTRLRECVVRGFMADMDTVGDCVFFNAEGLKAKYGLETKEDLMEHIEKEHPDLTYILECFTRIAPSQAK